jgi:hypothetical protein
VEGLRNWPRKVTRREDTKRRSGEEARSHPSEKDRWRRSKDLANSGARRVRTQVLGIQSHEDARSEKVITVGSRSRRTIGSARGIVHRSLARKGSRTWPRKSRSREGVASFGISTSGVDVEVIQPRE